MKRYLESMKVSSEEYEMYVMETLCFEKMMEQVVTEEKVEKFFRLNSPQFDSIDVSHIVVDSEGKAREIMAILGDEPERFAELADEYSIADTQRRRRAYRQRAARRVAGRRGSQGVPCAER